MPVQSCQEDGRPGWRCGESGKCYTYESGDDDGSKSAKKKAINQCIAEGEDPGHNSTEDPLIGELRAAFAKPITAALSADDLNAHLARATAAALRHEEPMARAVEAALNENLDEAISRYKQLTAAVSVHIDEVTGNLTIGDVLTEQKRAAVESFAGALPTCLAGEAASVGQPPPNPAFQHLLPMEDGPATEYLDQLQSAWGETVSADDKAALQRWKMVNGYERINSALRAGETVPDVPILDRVIESAPPVTTDVQTVVYRGVGNLRQALGEDVSVGTIVEDKGYWSVTTEPEVARDYSTPAYDRPEDRGKSGIIEVVLPPGQKGVWMRAVGLEDTGFYSTTTENLEMLLPRGQKYEVIAVSRDQFNTPIVTLKPILEQQKPDVIVAAAGCDGISISWDVTNPFFGKSYAVSAEKVTQIDDTTRARIMQTLRDSYEQGMSISQTADALDAIRGINASRASLIAQTEMTSLINGSTQAATETVAAATGDTYRKEWLTTPGAEHPRHEDYDGLDGQQVGLGELFDVGGTPLAYPGDPNGPADEVCNCRCTMLIIGPGGSEQEASDMTASADRPVKSWAMSRKASRRRHQRASQNARRVRVRIDESSNGTGNITVVPFTDADQALIDRENEQLALIAGASGSTSLPLSDRDAAWDAGAAKASLSEAQYGDAHFWKDPDKPADEIGSYKLPFAKDDGGLTAVWKGVTSAAGALQGARGGVQIPSGDKGAVRGKIEKYYSKAADKYDDPDIKPPWADGDNASIELQIGRLAYAESESLDEILERIVYWADLFAYEIEDNVNLSAFGISVVATGDFAGVANWATNTTNGGGGGGVAARHPLITLQDGDGDSDGDGEVDLPPQHQPQERVPRRKKKMGGEPSQGTPKDKRLKKNKSEAALDVTSPDQVTDAAPVDQPAAVSSLAWEATLCPEGVMTDDGRMFAEESISWRELPLTLMAMTETQEGHDGAQVAGRIDDIWRDGDMIRASGVFDDSEYGHEIARMVGDGVLRGVSVDIAVREYELAYKTAIDRKDAEDDPDSPTDKEDRDEGEDSQEPSLLDLLFGGEDLVFVVTDGVIGAVTVCPFPAFEEASIKLASTASAHKLIDEAYLCEVNCTGQSGMIVTRDKSLVAAAEEVLWDEEDGFNDLSCDIASQLNPGDSYRWWVVDIATTLDKALLCDGDEYEYYIAPFTIGDDREPELSPMTEWTKVEQAYIADDDEAASRRDAFMAMFKQSKESGSLTASAAGMAPLIPPAVWFENPELEEATPLTITDDGRVFGHAALWGTCHIGFPDACTQPPTSEADYAFFHLGVIEAENGDGENVAIPCGKVTMGTGHASTRLNAQKAAEHYDNTGTSVVDLCAGEDEYGIWVAGALRPDVSAEKVRELRASTLSGDWREIDGSLELVAMLAVNVPGFPVPRPRALITASAAEGVGQVLALTAAGVIPPASALTPEDRSRLDALAARARGDFDRFAALAARAREAA
jgi:hypothetical protein